MVLANTEELHDRIEGLKRRVRELEECLKEKEEPLSGSSSRPTRPAPLRLDRHSDEDSIIDAFGTLTIGSKGETSFLGKTARSEVSPPSIYIPLRYT